MFGQKMMFHPVHTCIATKKVILDSNGAPNALQDYYNLNFKYSKMVPVSRSRYMVVRI